MHLFKKEPGLILKILNLKMLKEPGFIVKNLLQAYVFKGWDLNCIESMLLNACSIGGISGIDPLFVCKRLV